MTAPMPPVARELAEVMTESRKIREALSALADGWETEAGLAEASREGSGDGVYRMQQGQRAAMLRSHARQVREAAGVRAP